MAQPCGADFQSAADGMNPPPLLWRSPQRGRLLRVLCRTGHGCGRKATLRHMGRTAGRLLACAMASLIAPSALWTADSGRELLDAASQGRTASARDLVAKGAPLETKDRNGRTPLMLAAQHGHAAIVQLLLEEAPTRPPEISPAPPPGSLPCSLPPVATALTTKS